MTPLRFLIALGVVWAAAGLIEPLLPRVGESLNEVGVVQGILTSVLLFGWCSAHARANAIRPALGARLLVGLLAPVGLPYYAFSGFGFRGGMRLIGMSILALVGLAAIYTIGFEISVRIRFGQFVAIF